ncbi:MAG: substrate-binding domain-containing protein, partial [Roseibacillus sp.]
DRWIHDLIDTHHADAVITDDKTAGLLASGLLRSGRFRVLEDLAIVGHRNDVTVHYTYPRLTTVDIMVSAVMERAVSLLANTDSPAKSQVIVPDLIVRDST